VSQTFDLSGSPQSLPLLEPPMVLSSQSPATNSQTPYINNNPDWRRSSLHSRLLVSRLCTVLTTLQPSTYYTATANCLIASCNLANMSWRNINILYE